MFNAWSSHLVPEVELCLVHLPGRDRRIKEPLQLQLSHLVETLTVALYPWLDKPFVFFGHSMGALLSFEVARQIRRRYSMQPSQLFVSGRQPPHIPDPNPPLHHLSEEEFIRTAQHLYGALPDVVLQDQDVLQLFMKIMRADLTMAETHMYQPDAPMDCPIAAYGGVDDPSTSEITLNAWRDQTTSTFSLQMFPGHHSFIQSSRPALLQSLKAELLQLLKAD
jgi:medium-chain acyl-[acyl-carrier-protein] hydrolase